MRNSSLEICVALLSVLAAPPLVFAQSLEGVWASEGYGNVYRVQANAVEVFQVTATTCVAAGRFAKVVTQDEGVEAAFEQSPGSGTITVVSGTSPDRKAIHRRGTVSDIVIVRRKDMPAACNRLTPDTPLDNFEVFARTWKEHYILFDQKRTDWDAVVGRMRPKVTSSTSPEALFGILASMIEPFEDAHTSIRAPDLERRFMGFRKGTDRVVPGGVAGFLGDGGRRFFEVELPRIFAPADSHYTRPPRRQCCNGQVTYAALDDSTGYLRLTSFSNYSSGGFAEGMVALEAFLDTVFADRRLRGLVIDVRINFGGSDAYGLALASRLATAEYVAYTKRSRSDPDNRKAWTPGQPSIVRPSRRPGFRGPVVELIGPMTISAGETFTQALMGRIPAVRRVGENTQGVFSDVMGRTLPNGWSFGLPNEVFLTNEGTAFDGPGIPPTDPVPVFPESDRRAGRDGALERALELLGRRPVSPDR